MRRVLVLALLAASCAQAPERLPVEQTAVVPEVDGLRVADAAVGVEDAGLRARVAARSDPEAAFEIDECPSAVVDEADPPAGSELLRTATVFLIVERC